MKGPVLPKWHADNLIFNKMVFVCMFLGTGWHISQIGVKCTMELRLFLNFWPFCLHPPSAKAYATHPVLNNFFSITSENGQIESHKQLSSKKLGICTDIQECLRKMSMQGKEIL